MKFPWRDFLLIMAVAIVARVLLLASHRVSFHSDEAVVALMARHITQGARPVFFYGQAYMGSLDAWVIAAHFQLFGDSVLSVRIAQSVLYMLVVATGYLAALRLSANRVVAAVAALLLAVPAVNTALYTTATLGGYNETLLFGNLVLLLGYDVTHGHERSGWRWGLLGLVAGLAWWTNGLIVMTVVPVGLMMLRVWGRQRRLPALPLVALALAAFVIGSAPWWVFDFTHNHAALATYLTNRQTGDFAGIGIPYVPPSERALGLFLIGIPTLIGLKFPWSGNYFLVPLGIAILLLYALAGWRFVRGTNLLRPDARLLIALQFGLFAFIFVASTFGADPTGRYFLPLVLPLGIVLGTLVVALRQALDSCSSLIRFAPWVLVALVIGYHEAGQVAAATSPTGFTTQFDLVSHIPNDHDADLIAFLEDNQLYHGFTNYWVAFRLAFLSNERLQYSSSLPYKANLSYNAADNRYPPYVEATAAADRVAYITTHSPALDDQLTAAFDAQGITYARKTIGEFHIYYDFSPVLPQVSIEALPEAGS